MSSESSGAILNRLIRTEAMLGRFPTLESVLKTIDSVTPAQIKKLAVDLFGGSANCCWWRPDRYRRKKLEKVNLKVD